MSWEWVTLILGTVLLIVLLLAFVAWTQMIQTNARMSYIRTKKEEDASQED